MMSVWQIPAAMFTLLAWLTSPSTSLADAARREAFRRQVTAASQSSYSNQTLPAARPGDLAAAATVGPDASVDADEQLAPAEVAAEPVAAKAEPAGASDEKACQKAYADLAAT